MEPSRRPIINMSAHENVKHNSCLRIVLCMDRIYFKTARQVRNPYKDVCLSFLFPLFSTQKEKLKHISVVGAREAVCAIDI